MSLLKNSSYLLTDSFGNIYNLLHKDEDINFITYDKILSKNKKEVLVKNCNEHFYSFIDRKNNINVFYQENKNNNIYFSTYLSGNWNHKIVVENSNKIYEPQMIKLYDNIHIFYFQKSVQKNYYELMHLVVYNDNVVKNKLFTIETNGILNPYNITLYNQGVIISYMNFKNYYHNIELRYFNLEKNQLGDEIVINEEKYEKYYLDTLGIDNSKLLMSYSAKQDENFKIICDYISLDHEKSKVESRAVLSNLSNCMYPTIILEEENIWVCWYELKSIMSSVKRRGSKKFEGPYLWNDSKGKDLLRYGYSSNSKNNIYKLNYSFGTIPPEISFIGFGELENAEKVPFKKNSKGGDTIETNNKDYIKPKKKYSYDYDDLEDLKIEIEENKKLITKILQSTIKENNEYEKLNKRISELEDRIKDIEDFLSRRRRGSIFSSR
ncbi:hypothetical protein [Senegalia massiliensis]|uniref:hypothetical protein n=1 Tax=Senegalia massiliensis TaxID=1720316 RepID=UPI0010317ED3|nr:hypothetical protein [Senegalia massiliensis]